MDWLLQNLEKFLDKSGRSDWCVVETMDVIGEASIDQQSLGTQAVVVSYPTFKICEVKMDRSEAVKSFQEQKQTRIGMNYELDY